MRGSWFVSVCTLLVPAWVVVGDGQVYDIAFSRFPAEPVEAVSVAESEMSDVVVLPLGSTLYSCKIPSEPAQPADLDPEWAPESRVLDPGHGFGPRINPSNPDLDPESATDAVTLLTPLKSRCLGLVDGWWTYEFCHESHVRQFHADASGVVMQEFVLGRYGAMWTQTVTASGTPPVSTDDDGRPFLQQRFDGGSECPDTGLPRSTLVRFYCAPQSAPHIHKVREIAICQYMLIVHSPHLCTQKRFRPLPTAEAHLVVCSPVTPATHPPLPNSPLVPATQLHLALPRKPAGSLFLSSPPPVPKKTALTYEQLMQKAIKMMVAPKEPELKDALDLVQKLIREMTRELSPGTTAVDDRNDLDGDIDGNDDVNGEIDGNIDGDADDELHHYVKAAQLKTPPLKKTHRDPDASSDTVFTTSSTPSSDFQALKSRLEALNLDTELFALDEDAAVTLMESVRKLMAPSRNNPDNTHTTNTNTNNFNVDDFEEEQEEEREREPKRGRHVVRPNPNLKSKPNSRNQDNNKNKVRDNSRNNNNNNYNNKDERPIRRRPIQNVNQEL